jgi:poly(A) polymerase
MSAYRLVVNGLKRLLGQTPITPHPVSSLPPDDNLPHTPRIISRSEHCISRQHINKNAVRVLYRLKDARFQAFLVGGGVRDMLLGRIPKDFDIATNATPEEVSGLFRNCRLIGRRFRLAHVHFGEEIIEVATFRARHDSHFQPDEDVENHDDQERVFKNGRLVRDNIYGSFEEDAWRRDFTINALYYNIYDFSVVDYTGGVEDLNARLIRLIGDPLQRYQEDPVRMLRAIRFAAKLDFTIHPETAAPIYDMGRLLKDIPSARLYEEVLKLFLSGHGWKSFELLQHYKLLSYLFPHFEKHFSQSKDLVQVVLQNTDERKQQHLTVSPVFLFAALLWTAVEETAKAIADEQNIVFSHALYEAGNTVSHQQHKRVAIPRRIVLGMKEIWMAQPRLEQAWRSKKALVLVNQPRFRAAFDFLVLRSKANPDLKEIADFWEALFLAPPDQRINLLNPPSPPQSEVAPKRKKRRRNYFKKKTTTN